MSINNRLTKLLGNDKEIKEVQVDQKVIDEIIKIAMNADPKEYVALLSGSINKTILKVTGLIFLPFEASDTSAVMQVFMMPMTTNAVGSVHSHPGPSAQPSNADLTFFSKNGYFHMIICRPYTVNTICAYDAYGNSLPFTITDLGDEVEIKQWDEIDIDKELFDEDLLNELYELEEEESKNMTNENNFENRTITSTDSINNNESKQPAMINLEFEVNGQIINRQLPLPPEYEPGDDVEVDVRTDKTPGDSIDEIVLNVKKSKKNLEKQLNEVNSITTKSSQEIDDEIKKMESEIEELKKENERLKNS
ncbi:Mov34/MPN/PAD-1 family protein [Methanosphaera sp. WGK6]|uniref:Mov34/MPN/PAD-1 family protein n=1 Tax=Methanosphaera sp. WGK6 TaxID=1561964 RepID=UPI00084CCE7F|nr:Mov34/MPN/PAD-1 family protein [Methanosphaera sp. WGK6]